MKNRGQNDSSATSLLPKVLMQCRMCLDSVSESTIPCLKSKCMDIDDLERRLTVLVRADISGLEYREDCQCYYC